MTAQTAIDKLSEPGDYDVVACDQFGIDYDGNPIADDLTGTGSDGPKAHDPDSPHKMTLTQEEQDILDGSQGPVMAKVLKTIVMHGELFGANGLKTVPDNPRGSRSKSLENRCKGKGQWNVYDVVCVDGTVKLSVNGKFVNGVRQASITTEIIEVVSGAEALG